jgi:CTP synthase
MIHSKVKVTYVPAEQVTMDNAAEKLAGVSGIFVAPGSGVRGFEGKVAAVRYARENNIPFFGVGLGMQASIIEFARDVLGMSDAHSRELDPQTKYPVIDLMEEQKKVTEKGGTMRLGGYPCTLKAGSKAAAAYGKESVVERHRHRYEFNGAYLQQFEAAGMVATGINPETGLVEVLEVKNHPWFVAVLFNPEYKSTVSTPAPLFVAFVAAALEYQKQNSAEKADK